MNGIKNGKLIAFFTSTFIAVNSFSAVTHQNEKYIKSAYHLTNTTLYSSSYALDTLTPYMYDTNIKIPIKEAMVPQGLTKADENFLISSYDYNKEKSSVVYVCDNNGNILNECALGIQAHVGGIAFDKENNLIWIAANNGYVNAYSSSTITEKEEDSNPLWTFDVGEGCQHYINPWKNSISYLSVDGNYLYVGSFSLFKNGLVKKYLIINNNNNISLSLQKSFKVPTKVQGLTIYHKDDQDYIIFSRSFGENIPSVLQIYKYQEDIDDYTNSKLNSVCYKTDAMMEQIIIDNNTLYALFESSSYPYRYSSTSAENIEASDMNLILMPK